MCLQMKKRAKARKSMRKYAKVCAKACANVCESVRKYVRKPAQVCERVCKSVRKCVRKRAKVAKYSQINWHLEIKSVINYVIKCDKLGVLLHIAHMCWMGGLIVDSGQKIVAKMCVFSEI